jgi:hypothetical protein
LSDYHDTSQAVERPNLGDEISPLAASHQAGDDEGGNVNPSIDNEELGKAPTLHPSMEDGAVVAPLPRPPMEQAVGAEPLPRPRERAVSAEPPPRPRERAAGAEKPLRPRVRAGAVAAAATSKPTRVEPFFFLAAANVDISGKPEIGDESGDGFGEVRRR